ncbi:MAG TPA: cytochrome c oxidase subunit 3, partial [Anaeromyxobacteraceae bacterium]|nr:cytochrome c oxidase subunit 3 [Anaeromyxobacteraceae bacterium]
MSDHAAHPAASGQPGDRFLAHHFRDMESQLATGKLGVWLFLGSEVLFFSGLFVAYGVYRANHYALFHYAHHFLDWRMGALNTVVLVMSSLSAAWSVRAAQLGDRKTLRLTLVLTLLLAGAFLAVKYVEYSHKLHNGIAWGAACHPSEAILATLPPAV